MRDEEAARDAAQEALISIARHVRAFDGRSRYSTWSYRIATNAALDEMRRASRRPVVSLLEEERTLESSSLPDVAGELVMRLSIDEALSRLSLEQQEVIRLRHGLGLDYSEMAERLCVPIGTVRSRLSRARLALGRMLEPSAEGNSPTVAHVQGDEEL